MFLSLSAQTSEKHVILGVRNDLTGLLPRTPIIYYSLESPKVTNYLEVVPEFMVVPCTILYASLSGCLRINIQHELGYRLELAPGAYTSYGSPGLSPASGFEHPASTLPTRFPAALGIGHG